MRYAIYLLSGGLKLCFNPEDWHLVAVGIPYHGTSKKQHTAILLLYSQLNCCSTAFFLYNICRLAWTSDRFLIHCWLCLICMFWPFLKIWNLATQVDLVEPVSHFLEAARENLTGCMDQGEDSHKAANFYCVPLQVGTYRSLSLVRYLWNVILFFRYNLVYFLLQDFTPEEGRYDVIWIQWCIGQLPDDDFISFFNRAKVNWLRLD